MHKGLMLILCYNIAIYHLAFEIVCFKKQKQKQYIYIYIYIYEKEKEI